jgi:hypothetical protein
MGRSRYQARNQNSVSFRVSARTLGPVSNTIVLIVLACLLGLLYLTQATKTNAYSYQIDALQKKQLQLKNEHIDLEVASAHLQSLDRAQKSDVAKSLVSVAPSGSVKN